MYVTSCMSSTCYWGIPFGLPVIWQISGQTSAVSFMQSRQWTYKAHYICMKVSESNQLLQWINCSFKVFYLEIIDLKKTNSKRWLTVLIHGGSSGPQEGSVGWHTPLAGLTSASAWCLLDSQWPSKSWKWPAGADALPHDCTTFLGE